MNTLVFKCKFSLLTCTALIVAFSGLSAQAQVRTPEAALGSADDLVIEPIITPTSVAQTVAPGRVTRSGPSYIGVGGNLGFGGRTALGQGNFAVISKIGLTNNLSARPAAIIGNRATLLLPVTVDFPIQTATPVGGFGVAPYVGGGAAISTSGRHIRPLVTGGVDVPLTSNFTANASANAGFLGRPEVGLMVGVGYNF